ncbi:hypothetical protein CGERO_04260 [Corynebacterium gerontici]|uniref:Uncharacterized protein n=1 Tax=Corynebacterium gerontici TaxID=2079234 RepID=A0A3G6IZE9_9CORY|nr:hypothetical protein CGERO_04260 [Corynebacterium gerontici]
MLRKSHMFATFRNYQENFSFLVGFLYLDPE